MPNDKTTEAMDGDNKTRKYKRTTICFGDQAHNDIEAIKNYFIEETGKKYTTKKVIQLVHQYSADHINFDRHPTEIKLVKDRERVSHHKKTIEYDVEIMELLLRLPQINNISEATRITLRLYRSIKCQFVQETML